MLRVAKSIVKNSHIDDYLASTSSLREAQELVLNVTLINGEANFVLHGWASNDPRAVEIIKGEDRLGSGEKPNLCAKVKRVLGLFWDKDSDNLGFNVGVQKIPASIANGLAKPTKRHFFSLAMSVYDQLGILAPFTCLFKIVDTRRAFALFPSNG